MAISSSSPSSGDWSMASLVPYRKSHTKYNRKPYSSSLFSSINLTCSLRAAAAFQVSCHVINSSSTTTTNVAPVNLDRQQQQLQVVLPEDAENLNELLCALFQDPKTEAMGYEHYVRARNVQDFRPNKSTLEHVTRYLIRSKKWDSILSLCDEFKTCHLVPDSYTCSRLITSCIRARKFRIVKTLLEVFNKYDKEVATLAFDSAMRGYNELHMYKSTISVFDKMVSSDGIDPNSGCYCRIMEAYFKQGEHRKVVELFHEVKSKQLDLTPLSTQIVCESLAKLGKPLEALKIFRSVTNLSSLESSKIYSVLICSFASIREVKAAEELFQEAETKKMLRDPVLFLRMITMYVEEGLVDKTLEVVKSMKGAKIRVSDNICCAVVSGFSKKSRLQTAVKAFEILIAMGCKPGQVTYASMINVYFRLGLHSKAETVFQEMEAKGFDKCVVAYSTMVVMYGKTGRPREAMRLVAKMKERGCKPNVWIYNSLMDMHGRDNNLRQVEKLWSEMKRRKVAPDKVSFTTLIGAYNKAGDFEMCMRFYNEYRTHGGVLDKAMAGMMVGVFSKSGRVDELVKLLRDMKAEGAALDVRLYRSALHALADSGMDKQVKWLQDNFEVT